MKFVRADNYLYVQRINYFVYGIKTDVLFLKIVLSHVLLFFYALNYGVRA